MAYNPGAVFGKTFTSGDLTGYLNKTRPRVIKEIQDAIFNESTYLKWMEKFGAVKRGEGGSGIQMHLRMAKNTTVGARQLRSGIPLDAQDQHRVGFETWAEYSGAAVFDALTLKTNQGPEQLIPVFEEEIFNLKTTMADTVNTDLMTGSGVQPTLTGIDSLISTTPTTGTIHGITRSGNSWAQNQQIASSCATTDGFGPICVQEADRLLKLMSPQQGWRKVKMCLMDDAVHANMLYYMPRWASMVPQVLPSSKITGKVDAANADDPGQFMFRGAVSIWDHAAPTDSIRFITPGIDGICIHVVKDLDFKVESPYRAENSFNTNIIVGAAMLQMNHNPRRSGVLHTFSS